MLENNYENEINIYLYFISLLGVYGKVDYWDFFYEIN